MVSSLSKRSMVVIPFNFTKAFSFTPSVISSTWSLRANIFTVMESVKSVIEKIMMVFSLRISRFSRLIIWPRIHTSPISVCTVSKGSASSSKSLPYNTSGLSERLTLRLKSEENFSFFPLVLGVFSPLPTCFALFFSVFFTSSFRSSAVFSASSFPFPRVDISIICAASCAMRISLFFRNLLSFASWYSASTFRENSHRSQNTFSI